MFLKTNNQEYNILGSKNIRICILSIRSREGHGIIKNIVSFMLENQDQQNFVYGWTTKRCWNWLL